MSETTYTSARANLASLCKEAEATGEPIIIHRRKAADVALISAAELRGLMETAHLLRSPKNAERLSRALARIRKGRPAAQSVDDLRRSLRLDR
ncbi:MAG: type II toxin-antitoxin system Phd/YefM family antitoxin [Elusimicrobia bacterium]|nr:type II toxin-antitoxin system Phd/YefM family antitoxin [Elusimicrobiota bacterium]